MDIFHYTANLNPQGTASIIQKYGFRPYTQPKQGRPATFWNGESLRQLVQQYGEPAREDIITIHPDWNLITSKYQAPQIIDQKKEIIEIKSNADGHSCSCGGKCGSRYSNADGDTSPSAPVVGQKTGFVISNDTLFIITTFAIGFTLYLHFKGK